MNTTKRFYRFVVALVTIGWLWVGLNTFFKNRQYDVCIFKRVWGIPCPACGTTRSLLAILNGQPEAALRLNSLGYIAFIAMAVLPLWLMYDGIRKRSSLFNYYNSIDAKVRQQPVWLVMTLLIISINWIWILWRSQ